MPFIGPQKTTQAQRDQTETHMDLIDLWLKDWPLLAEGPVYCLLPDIAQMRAALEAAYRSAKTTVQQAARTPDLQAALCGPPADSAQALSLLERAAACPVGAGTLPRLIYQNNALEMRFAALEVDPSCVAELVQLCANIRRLLTDPATPELTLIRRAVELRKTQPGELSTDACPFTDLWLVAAFLVDPLTPAATNLALRIAAARRRRLTLDINEHAGYTDAAIRALELFAVAAAGASTGTP